MSIESPNIWMCSAHHLKIWRPFGLSSNLHNLTLYLPLLSLLSRFHSLTLSHNSFRIIIDVLSSGICHRSFSRMTSYSRSWLSYQWNPQSDSSVFLNLGTLPSPTPFSLPNTSITTKPNHYHPTAIIMVFFYIFVRNKCVRPFAMATTNWHWNWQLRFLGFKSPVYFYKIIFCNGMFLIYGHLRDRTIYLWNPSWRG